MSDPGPRTMPVPAAVLDILRRLEDAGYETWCVGGAVRDALLGNPQQDVDLATAATPAAVRKLFKRTIPVGIEHGTVGVLDDAGTLHEVTTFRRDVSTDGRHAVVEFGVSLDDDLARRDFTINAIAYHPLTHAWRDPFDGRGDLERRLVRAVGLPRDRFREDRLRILRALRFAARFDFTIDGATLAAAQDEAAASTHLSAERVRDEWVKGLATAKSRDHLAMLWQESGVATVWLPELHVRHRDSNSRANATPGVELLDDVVLVTARYCAPLEPALRRLKCSNADIARAEALDRGPRRPPSADAVDVRRWMAGVGRAASDLAQHAAWSGEDQDGWIGVMDDVRSRGDATSRGELAVSGTDLLDAGVGAGPALGATLARLLDAVLDDPALNTRETLLALARRGS